MFFIFIFNSPKFWGNVTHPLITGIQSVDDEVSIIYHNPSIQVDKTRSVKNPLGPLGSDESIPNTYVFCFVGLQISHGNLLLCSADYCVRGLLCFKVIFTFIVSIACMLSACNSPHVYKFLGNFVWWLENDHARGHINRLRYQWGDLRAHYRDMCMPLRACGEFLLINASFCRFWGGVGGRLFERGGGWEPIVSYKIRMYDTIMYGVRTQGTYLMCCVSQPKEICW